MLVRLELSGFQTKILLCDVTGLSKAALIQMDVSHGIEAIAVQGAAAMLDGQVDG